MNKRYAAMAENFFGLAERFRSIGMLATAESCERKGVVRLARALGLVSF